MAVSGWMPCRKTIGDGATATDASGTKSDLVKSTAGSAAEQAIVQAATPPFMSCCGARSGQCSMGMPAMLAS